MEDSEKNLDFDTILDLVGGGGKWQWRKLFWLAPAHIAYGIPLLLHLFTAYAPSHRCYVQGCDSALNPDFHAGTVFENHPKNLCNICCITIHFLYSHCIRMDWSTSPQNGIFQSRKANICHGYGHNGILPVQVGLIQVGRFRLANSGWANSGSSQFRSIPIQFIRGEFRLSQFRLELTQVGANSGLLQFRLL